MEAKIKHYRISLLINGVIAILFGLFALFVPGGTALTVVKYFGLVLIIGGGFGLVNAMQNMKLKKSYFSILFSSIVGILAGLFIMIYTSKSLEIFAIVIGIWAVILGVMQLIIAWNVMSGNKSKKLVVFNGILTLVFGLILFFNPLESVKALTVIVGILALMFGGILIYLNIIFSNIDQSDK